MSAASVPAPGADLKREPRAMRRYFPEQRFFQTTSVDAVLLQVIDERRTQQRLGLAITVLRIATLAAELPPQRHVLVDDRADRVGRAVELADVVRVGQVLGNGPEELDVVVLARHGEGALAQLLGGQSVQLGEARGGHDGKHRAAGWGPVS